MPAFQFRSEDLSRLRRLTFAARMPSLVRQEGQHRTRRAGAGLDFLDYRPYVPGDDPRYVDWNLYGRLRQLVVRVFENPENLSINVLVDTSRSMSFGQPMSKAAHACRIAAAIAYVALTQGERLSVATFSNELNPLLGPMHQRAQFRAVLEYLIQAGETGATKLYDCMHAFCGRMRRKGLVVLISDFLTEESYPRALRLPLSRGCKLLVIQVLDRLDLGAGLDGQLRLRDSETGAERLVFVDAATRGHLRASVESYCAGLARFCRGFGQRYVETFTDQDALELVCHLLRTERLR